MRFLSANIKNIQISFIILMLPILPLVTSLLLDLQFIQLHFVRQLIVFATMLLEVVVLILVFIHFVKTPKKTPN